MGGQVMERPDVADSAKRRQIIDGARRVFLAEGFDGASMGEIARAAGVSKGTLYVYFDSKEALFEALAHSRSSELAEVMFSLDESDEEVETVLRRLGVSLLEHMIAPDHVASVRMVIGTADKMPRFGRLFYDAGPANGAARLRAYLDREVEAGRLRVADTSLAAEQFLNLCSAGILKKLLFVADTVVTPGDIAFNVNGAIDVFLAAYGPDRQVSSRKAVATRA